MKFADEIMALEFGQPRFEALRACAKVGQKDAIRKYVYFCAWRGILGDKFIPAYQKATLFRKLVEADLIEVKFG